MENIGILAGVAAAFLWGTYMVPFKKSNSSNIIYYQTLMGIGILISGFILSFLLGFSINLNIYGLLSGIMWAAANLALLSAIANLGLTRAIPLITSLIIICSFLWGALAFNELPSGFLLPSLGIFLIIFGIVIVSTLGKSESKNNKKGFLSAIISGLLFGSQLAPLKLGNLSNNEFFFPLCFGIFLSAILIGFFKKVKFENRLIPFGLLSGLIWNIGNLLSIIAISEIGLARGFPIAQSAVLISTIWGVFYFKEIRKLRQIIQVLLGAIILFIGIIILTQS